MNANTNARVRDSLAHIERTLLLVFALAWPLGLYQQIPYLGVTLAKVAGVLLIATVAIEFAFTRDKHALKSGLEWPIALLAIVCGQSCLHSVAWQASAPLMLQYVSYLVLFYAFMIAARSGENADLAMRAFAWSSTAVAALALLCACGIGVPAIIETTSHTGRRLGQAMFGGPSMRIAAAMPDLNEGVFPFVLALPFVLWRRPCGEGRNWRRLGDLVMAALLVIGIAVSFSRSAMIAAGVLLIARLVDGLRAEKRLRRLAIPLIVLCAISAVATATGYLPAWGERAMRGLTSPDASYSARWYAFQVAWQLVPRYGWLGCGLGAADVAIAQVADPARLQGVVLHSVPFRLLVETGLVGLVGYVFFWWALLRQVWQRVRAADSAQRGSSIAALGSLLACFWILAIQPFSALSLFPFLAAMALRPVVMPGGVTDAAPARPRAKIRWQVALCLFALAGLNFSLHTLTALRACRYGARVESGTRSERQGAWMNAKWAYSSACDNALGKADPQPLAQAPYFDSIRDHVADLEFAFEAMEVRAQDVDLVAVCQCGLARTFAAQHDWPAAIDALHEALRLDPKWAYARFLLGEACWAAGRFGEATQAYAQAAQDEPLAKNAEFAQWIRRLDTRIEALRALEDQGSAEASAERATLLIRRGRWQEAVALCQHLVADLADPPAQAYFLTGVLHELAGERKNAIRRYGEALKRAPEHAEAATRLHALSGAPAENTP